MSSRSLAELMVDALRDELRSVALALTPREREKRERIVELWENDELTPTELATCLTALWSPDWPDNGMAQFLRKTNLAGVPFAVALREADEETRERVFALLARDEP